LRSLKQVVVPQVPGVERYVRDRAALVVLGKALFWDMQAGSDGRTACASCHFHAGADHRAKNQISDPLNGFPVNLALEAAMFPLRKLADSTNRNSTVLADTGMRVGSAGVYRREFKGIVPGEAAEAGVELYDAQAFTLNGLNTRRVTGRNTPSVINSVYYQRGFWDGRALQQFTQTVRILRDGRLENEEVRLTNAQLANQAVGPILDHVEMSYAGRSWQMLARKMFHLAPLGLQQVAADDSVLGPFARIDGRGLVDEVSYLRLIQKAFAPELWESGERDEYSQAENNFGFFWALALQAYQATLISDDSPFDRFADGDRGALTALQQEGLRFFQQQGRCTTCHSGAEFSNAVLGNNNRNAFQRTGVRPQEEDAGAGNGSFKSIGLRNVELTGPYFHNGGQATLEQLMDFYARGGDFANNSLRPFAMTSAQRAAVVEFLKSLTDERVRYSRAPFDHPELCVPIGHQSVPGNDPRFPRAAAEQWAGLPATGAFGERAPLQTFDELLHGIGGDGSRSNTMTRACTIP